MRVILSDSAAEVHHLPFNLSRNDVYINTFDEKDSKKIAHIDLADWAESHLVVSANVIGKLAGGIADNMITTTLFSGHCSCLDYQP